MVDRPEFSNVTFLTNPTIPKIQGKSAAVVSNREYAAPERLSRVWWDQVGVYRAARLAGNEWLLLPKGYASFIRRPPVKLVSYIHDAMQDHYRRHHPKGFPRFENLYFLAGMRAAIAQSNRILVNTEFTAAEVRRMAANWSLPVPPLHVVGIGFEQPQRSEKSVRTRIIVLASQWPHKRTDLALRYMVAWQEQTDFQGTVDWIGQLPPGTDLPSKPGWQLHSRLLPKDWSRMMGEALALVYFSEYEGFGMPPVEAAIAGACPVYSDLPVTREVMEGAGHAFSNERVDNFIASLNAALKTSGDQVHQWADKLLARHSWRSVAERATRALLI